MAGVIVTGGFGALGRAVVAELVDRGLRVAAVDAAPAPVGTGAEIAMGGVDLTSEPATEQAYARLAERLDGLSGLVNIAGGFVWEPVIDGAIESWDRMYSINLRTAATSTRAALRHLLKSGGSIVNVGAAGAVRPGAGMAPYAASKAGVHALTESLAEELRSRGVRVNAILPTTLDTPTNRSDMPDADTSGWVKPASAARVVAFLLSEQSAAITGVFIPLSLAG